MEPITEGLTLYRRHEAACRFKRLKQYNKCDCPIWIGGQRNAVRTRRSMKTRDWSDACARLTKLEAGEPVPQLETSRPVSFLVSAYIADCRRRKLAPNTIARYELALKPFVATFGDTRVSHLTLGKLTDHQTEQDRATPGSGRLSLIVLRMLLNFAVDRDEYGIARNPLRKLKAAKYEAAPTMPFTADEVTAMLAACDELGGNRRDVARERARAKALVLTLLYSGLRISDVTQLRRGDLDMTTRKLHLRVIKTKVPLYVTLHADAVAALKALPVESPIFFFWSGRGKLKVAINSLRTTIKNVAKRADVVNAHPHRFRDHFAIELLLNNVPIDRVQKLLGHKSVKTTQDRYAPHVAGMQRGLDEAVATLHFGPKAA